MVDRAAVRVHGARMHGRPPDRVRPIRVVHDAFGYAPGNVLLNVGQTRVLCSASIQQGVPPFLKGSRTGWLSAEYAMLPMATTVRTLRESVVQKRCGRAVEISRLIGRVLRAVVDLSTLGERTITIDCDVLQADGGTRSAAISGGCIALSLAQERWLADKTLQQPFLVEKVAAVSVGVVDGCVLVDLDGAEDNNADVDFNFAVTSAGGVVEIQGSVEKNVHVTWSDVEKMHTLAASAIKGVFASLEGSWNCASTDQSPGNVEAPMFCLKNRLGRAP